MTVLRIGGINANGQTYGAEAETAPSHTQAIETPPVETSPVESQPVETQPVETQADTVPPAALDAAESLAIVSGETPEAVEEAKE